MKQFKLLDLNTWNRKEHFEFFSSMEEPFFGVTVELEVSKLYREAKTKNESFFLHYLYASLQVANEIEPFRYRINTKKQVVIYDKIDASPTISRENGTFGFSYIPFRNSFSEFKLEAEKEIKRVRSFEGLGNPAKMTNVIYFSSLPWLRFSAISHARKFSFQDSVPKISFGKMTIVDRKRILPISIHVHHGLMDGFHVGQYVQKLQDLFNE